MPESLLRRANEFTPQERQAVEVLVGRPLRAGESVSVRVLPSIPSPQQRDDAWERLFKFMDRMSERTKDVSDDEFEAALQEALDHVRHNPE